MIILGPVNITLRVEMELQLLAMQGLTAGFQTLQYISFAHELHFPATFAYQVFTTIYVGLTHYTAWISTGRVSTPISCRFQHQLGQWESCCQHVPLFLAHCSSHQNGILATTSSCEIPAPIPQEQNSPCDVSSNTFMPRFQSK